MNDMPSKSQIAKWWYGKNDCILDMGEPDCWACGRYDPKFNDIFAYLNYANISIDTYRNNPDKYIVMMWNNASLERHHIIPVSKLGKNEVDNLVLLCSDCHANAPHVDSPDYFWQWVKNRKNEISDKYLGVLKEACRMVGLDFDKNVELIRSVFIVYQIKNHPAHDKLYSEVSKILTFHPYASWESSFRDEMYCLFSVVKSNPHLIPDDTWGGLRSTK